MQASGTSDASRGCTRQLLPLLSVVWMVIGCGEDSNRAHERLDAGATPLDARAPSPDASSYSFRLERGPCLGSCAEFSVTLDQSGYVEYVGRTCTERPGVFAKQIPPAGARVFYGELLEAKYWTLDDAYTSDSPNCPNAATDGPVSLWDVKVDGLDKPLERYHGCDLPQLAAIDPLESSLRSLTGVNSWIGSVSACSALSETIDLATNYVLSLAGQPLGVLALHPGALSWGLRSCAGEPLASGMLLIESRRWILLDGQSRPLSLDGGVGDLGSIVLEDVADAGLSGRGLRATDDVAFTLEPDSGC